uniref:uncharacterized protein LOC122601427 n=1 Tax=Erigeron canadensis TaxID=72917 RepID=UPI001CB9BB25|nr:uncharacterized protein LOC122601427 [Erigeron canadensis]
MLSVSRRKYEPAHYMLKIENFSVLAEDEFMKFESDVFEASGHKWLSDTESLPKGWEVYIDGNRTKFNGSNKIWGFDKLKSLESFKESTNGYLLNDACVFGVEVFVVSGFAQKDRCLSFVKPPAAMNSYTWTIDKFSDLTEEKVYSSVFKIGNVKWKLCLFPKGKNNTSNHSSLYIGVPDHDFFPDGWRVYAKFKFRVKNHSSGPNIEKETKHWFNSSADDWGLTCFVPLNELHKSANGLLVNDVLIVEVQISMLAPGGGVVVAPTGGGGGGCSSVGNGGGVLVGAAAGPRWGNDGGECEGN